MSHDAEVVVVGAGVAGCATALGLAARGVSVLVVDRAEFPREKPCGEGLMPHGLEALGSLGVSVRGRPFRGITYTVGDAVAAGQFPDGLTGLGVRRRDLDAALVDACQADPRVEVRTGVRVRGVRGTGGSMHLDTDSGRLGCRAVVGADGLHSPVRRHLGLHRDSRARRRYGVRQHYRLARGVSEGEHVEVHVLPDQGVELYLTPTGPGEINLALLVEHDAMAQFRGDVQRGLRAVVRDSALAERLDGADPSSQARAIGPLRQEVRAGVADGALLVGDAAGFLDAITGEGMSLTLISSSLAADVLARGLRSGSLGADALAEYDRLRHRRARDLTWLTSIILWGIRHRRLARHVVRNLGRHPALFERVLAVNVDRAPLSSIGLGGVRRLVLGV